MIDPRGPYPTEFEYKIVSVPLPINNEDMVAQLNELGIEGWRLVFVTIVNEGRLWLVRELTSVKGLDDGD